MSRLFLLNILLLAGIAMATLKLLELRDETARREEEPLMDPIPKNAIAVARVLPSLLALVRTTVERFFPPVIFQIGGIVKMRLCQRAKITGCGLILGWTRPELPLIS